MTSRPPHRLHAALRHCRLWLIAVWVVTSAPWLASAQPDSAMLDEPPVVPPAPVSSLRTDGPQTSRMADAPDPVRGSCDPDYWIVSTRCAKEEVEAGQGVEYQVYRFDGPSPVRGSSIEELLSSLQPGVPVCFMAHGSFVTWNSMLNDSAWTYRWLRQAAPAQPVHIIFYTWASNDGGFVPHLHINKLGRRASLNGFYLADLVARVSVDHPICLIGHSHGSRLVSSALHSLGGGIVEGRQLAIGPQPARHIRVVMAAAAIDHDWLNPDQRYGRALCQAEAVINLQNRTDFPLLFYPLRRPISASSMATTGLTRNDRVSLGQSNQKFIDYSVSHQIGVGHIWAHYYRQPQIADAIRHYVYFDESPREISAP